MLTQFQLGLMVWEAGLGCLALPLGWQYVNGYDAGGIIDDGWEI